jgi:hypothetical protein
MDESRFDQLMRDAARTFRRPPEPPLEAMWAEIEREHFGSATGRRWRRWIRPALGLAASLAIGVGIGRVTAPVAAVQPAPVTAVSTESDRVELSATFQAVTSRYLGQTAALLAALPLTSDRVADATLASRAADLLSTTRLLLDSPPADDPELRVLFEDLELVLAQVVWLPQSRSPDEIQLITDAIEQREVLMRLHDAVTSIPLSSTN